MECIIGEIGLLYQIYLGTATWLNDRNHLQLTSMSSKNTNGGLCLNRLYYCLNNSVEIRQYYHWEYKPAFSLDEAKPEALRFKKLTEKHTL